MSQKTITIDTNEWQYPDAYGVTHTVTNAQTMTFELTDGGASAVTWKSNAATLTTTDGKLIVVRPQADTANSSNLGRAWGPKADAQQGAARYNIAGELCTQMSGGPLQCWTPAVFNVDDTDAPTSITATFEDQFDNSFTWSAVTVA